MQTVPTCIHAIFATSTSFSLLWTSKTATEFLYLESSALPLKYKIASRTIMFLQNILKRRGKELVKRVYNAQKNKPTTGDFIDLVKKDLEMVGQDFDEEFILSETTSHFKSHIKNPAYGKHRISRPMRIVAPKIFVSSSSNR